MIKIEKICIGNLMQCTKYKCHDTLRTSMSIGSAPCCSTSFGYVEKESELLEKDVVLLKIKKGGFVRLDSIHSINDYLKINQCFTENGYKLGSIMLSTAGGYKGEIFVDEKSIKITTETEKETNYFGIKKLQKQLLPQKN